jgi:tyrosine-protein phosphatase YwqE
MIFSFFKQKKKDPQRGPKLQVDIHSHLIPGIDDGSQSMEESLLLLRSLESLGYTKVITTPHIMSDYYKNSAQTILPKLELLREEAVRTGITLQIEAAAEYYLDEGFFEQMQKQDIMAIEGKYVLFETSYISKPLQMEEMIFAIGEAGYIPILAHPERYRYIKEPLKEYGRLRDLGVMFQVNLNSFSGHYGQSAKQLAYWLNERGMIDFLGSDTHHKKHVASLEKVFYTDIYKSIFDRNKIQNDNLV